MGNLSDYFESRAYKPTWFIGDRVKGTWNNIPFRGTVGNDSVVSEIEGPRVTVHLDLPIRYQDKTHNIIVVKPKDLKEFQ